MGWCFIHGYDKQALVKYLRSPKRFGSAKLLQSSVVGNNHWYLAETKGVKWIGLDLLKGGREDGWGYKDLNESCGPFQVNCPITYLDKADPCQGEYALKWREKVRAYHARKSQKPKAGDIVRLGGSEYKLIEPFAPRRGWRVLCIETGNKYRLNARQLSRAEKVQ